MKRPFLLVAVLLLSLQLASAQLSSFPDDPRFDAPVALHVDFAGEPVRDVIVALASSVGLTPIVDDIEEVRVTINYNITEGRPFRQLWNLILSLHNLNFLLLGNDIVVISIPEVIDQIGANLLTTPDPITGELIIQRPYPVLNQQDELSVEELKLLLDEEFSPESAVNIRAFPNLNIIVVRGTQEEHQRALQVLSEVDRSFEGQVLRRYPLAFARAETVVGILQQTTRVRRVTIGPDELTAPQERREVEEGASIVYAADPVTNSVLVTATEREHREIALIIADIDRAAEAAELDRVDVEPIVQQTYRVARDVQAITDFLRREFPGLDLNTFPDLNIISIRATQAQHNEIAALLVEVDRPVGALEQRLYTLSNAQAAELAQVLQEAGTTFLETVTTVEGETVTTQEGDLTVVPDIRTNSLLITAPPVIHQRITELLPELDAPQPQVNVQVRIQEIQTRAAHELGISLTGGVGSFAATLIGGGLNFIFNPQSILSGLNIGAVLDTLETQGLSRRVDDSNLTMLNNTPARLNSGGRIEITFPGADGQITFRTIEFGVIITITPRIAADGRVILDIAAEVSDIATPLGTGIPQRIDFTTREVSSSVTLEPGQTVVLGGLLQNSFSTDVERLPILGHLPLVGDLFSSRTLSEDNTELLLVINAVIIE